MAFEMSKEMVRRRRQRLLIAAAAGAVLVGALFWFLRRAIPESYRQVNIVLVTADTLRADHLPAYGYKRVRTPNIDAMAAEALEEVQRDGFEFEFSYSQRTGLNCRPVVYETQVVRANQCY